MSLNRMAEAQETWQKDSNKESAQETVSPDSISLWWEQPGTWGRRPVNINISLFGFVRAGAFCTAD